MPGTGGDPPDPLQTCICSPDIPEPSEYLPEIWGGEMANDQAFIDRQEVQDFLSLLLRHWNSIVRILQEEDGL